MFLKYFIPLSALTFLAFILPGCSDPQFTVKGEISDAKGKTLILEKADHAGQWVAIDSTSLGKSGKFSFRRIAPADPEIFRLDLSGQYLYFPIDSTETVSITAPAEGFSTNFTIDGSENALMLGKFEKELIAFAPHLQNPDSSASFKRRIFSSYLQDARGSVVSYYILTKTIGDKALFGEPDDGKYFAAVATGFKQFRPDDPRTSLLEQAAMSAQRKMNQIKGRHKVVEAEEINYIPISLTDENNSEVSLSSVAGKGVPTLLLFSDLSDPMTPAMNMKLKSLFDKGSIRIYNVGVANDQLEWRNAAKNLPWVTVYADVSDAARLAASYQLQSLPAFFIIDAAGRLKARCTEADEVLSFKF